MRWRCRKNGFSLHQACDIACCTRSREAKDKGGGQRHRIEGLCPNKHARERRLDKATMLLGRPDPTTNSKCQRGSCPYLHVSDLLASQPGMTTEELLSIIPCTFAGTKGGYWWHSKWRRSAQLWKVPEFELAENEEESRPLEGVTVDDDNEHILVNYNGETLLRRRGAERCPEVDQYEIDMRMPVRRWLQGYDDDEED